MERTRAGKPDHEAVPFQGEQPAFMPADLVHPGVLDRWLSDDELWVPMSPAVWFKPVLLSTSQGYFVNLLRVRKAGVLSRHRHAGPVHALVLKGRWRYLEHDWEATAGAYVYEPPGETHTLVVPDDVDEMITWFHVTGGYTYVDPQGQATGYEDVFTKLATAQAHYAEIGRGAAYVEQFIR